METSYWPHEIVTTARSTLMGDTQTEFRQTVFLGGQWQNLQFRMTFKMVAPTVPTISVAERFLPSPRVTNFRHPERDSDSFTKIVQSGRIKMSKYFAQRSIEVDHLVHFNKPPVVVVGSLIVSYHVWYNGWWQPIGSKGPQGWRVDNGDPSYNTTFAVQPPTDEAPWVEYVERRTWSIYDLERLLPRFQAYSIDPVGPAIETAKTDSMSKMANQYDALTDMSELGQTVQLGVGALRSALNPIKSLKEAIRRAKRGHGVSSDALARAWLTYQYGIMPIVYSIQDIHKLIEEASHKFRTTRARYTLQVTEVDVDPQFRGLIERAYGETRVNATVKASFQSPQQRRAALTGINLPSTMWELLRYSLVVDWFSNFGDWLLTRTTLFYDLVEQWAACYSVRTIQFGRVECKFLFEGHLVEGVLRTSEISSYERQPFTHRDAKLSVRVDFLNWKQTLSAIALAILPLNKALRRLL